MNKGVKKLNLREIVESLLLFIVLGICIILGLSLGV